MLGLPTRWYLDSMVSGLLHHLESIEADRLNLGLYTTRVTAEALCRAIAGAEGVTPPLIEIEVIRQGIRCSTDYGWRRFLEPKLCNVWWPETNARGFHQGDRLVPGSVYDPVLMGFAGTGEGE